MSDKWTDERLDDLNHRVESIDRRMETGFADIRTEFRAMRGEMNSRFESLEHRLDAQHRQMVQMTYGLCGTMLVGFLGTIAAIVTQA
jgi:hypothetical protein